jgi:hypothetical protein
MRIRIWLLLALLASGITWLYVSRVLGPWGDYNGLKRDGVKTQMGDLYSPWVGTRELLLHRRNPYAPEVSHEIQKAFYGHAIYQKYGESGVEIVNEQRFAYPVYVVFLMAPAMYFDFTTVYRFAPLALGLLVAASVPLCLDLLRWRLSTNQVAAITLFVVSSPQIAQGMNHQQLALVVGSLLISGAWCINKGHLMTGGALLALSTIKPQMSLLPLCWFLIWTMSDWFKRKNLFFSFFASLAALIFAGELVLRGWPSYFIAGVADYRKYAPTSSLLRVALGDTLGEIVGAIIIFALLALAWRNRSEASHTLQFSPMFAAFLMGGVLTFPLFTPYNQVLLILPVLLLLREWKALPRFSRLVFIVIASWPWVMSAALLLHSPRLDSPNRLPLLPSFLVSFFPLFLPLLLMTRRSGHTTLQPRTIELSPT